MSATKQIVKAAGEGEKRWFYGGGLHTWKATSEEANGAFFVIEDELGRGKSTPLHAHPQDEIVFVVEGELLCYGDGVEKHVGPGTTIITPRGVPHAFTVLSERARIFVVQTPGGGDAFYRNASEPAGAEPGPVDFRKLGEVAKATGATEILGPPPFKR